MLRIITILLVTLALNSVYIQGHGKVAGTKKCHLQHQVWRECGSSCPRNCENYLAPKAFCSMSCVPGCFCRVPFIFYKGNSGICVLPKKC